GRPGVALAALVAVLLDLVCSGGPIGSQLLPDAYRWLAPGMPAGQLYSAIRGALYFDGAGVGEPVLVLVAWLAGGVVLLAVGRLAHRARPSTAAVPAHAANREKARSGRHAGHDPRRRPGPVRPARLRAG